MRLYHGNNIAVETPKLIAQTRGLAFGSGFYLTTNEYQAERLSEIVVNRRKSGVATVSIYDFDEQIFDEKAAEKTLAIRRFERADAAWLRFVVDNRLNRYSGESEDIVIGAVANDAVMPTIQAFLGGFINEEAASDYVENEQTCRPSVYQKRESPRVASFC